jgi:hypothetical protein
MAINPNMLSTETVYIPVPTAVLEATVDYAIANKIYIDTGADRITLEDKEGRYIIRICILNTDDDISLISLDIEIDTYFRTENDLDEDIPEELNWIFVRYLNSLHGKGFANPHDLVIRHVNDNDILDLCDVYLVDNEEAYYLIFYNADINNGIKYKLTNGFTYILVRLTHSGKLGEHYLEKLSVILNDTELLYDDATLYGLLYDDLLDSILLRKREYEECINKVVKSNLFKPIRDKHLLPFSTNPMFNHVVNLFPNNQIITTDRYYELIVQDEYCKYAFRVVSNLPEALMTYVGIGNEPTKLYVSNTFGEFIGLVVIHRIGGL